MNRVHQSIYRLILSLAKGSLLFSLSLCVVACEDSSPTNETTVGEMTAGETTAGEAAAGEATAGEATASETTAGETTAGETSAGETLAGEATAGETMAGEATAGETSGGQTTAGESLAGETSAGEEERMPSCLLSCAEFVECAIKQCPGYDQTDDALLMEECLGLCNTNIAQLFDQLTGCPEKIRFASTVRTDFLDFCDSVTEGFCETYVATCGEWLGETACDELYNEAPLSGDEYTSGAHRQCYEFHLGTAQRGLEEGDQGRVQQGCERAAGLNTCVND